MKALEIIKATSHPSGGTKIATLVSSKPVAPWYNIKAEQVRVVIEGSKLAEMVSAMEGLTDPPLPLEITLPKSLVLAGCGLTQPMHPLPVESDTRRGIELSKFRIETAGGQACNVWALIVAASGTGKDIGNVPEKTAEALDLHLGTSGSAEGLADAFEENGAGLLTIDEFSPWLDDRTWQSKAASFITSAWNKGSFRFRMSKKRESGDRASRYCFPSIIAAIQPATIRAHYTSKLLDSGFLARFLPSVSPDTRARRPRVGASDAVARCLAAVKCYMKTSGSITPPDHYLQAVADEFTTHDAKYPALSNRLVNEYGPRFAVMLAIDGSQEVIVKPEHWEQAAVLIRWFYGMGEALFDELAGTETERRREDSLSRFLAFIKKHDPCPKAVLSRQMSYGTTAKEREDITAELAARGEIEIITDDGRTVYTAKG